MTGHVLADATTVALPNAGGGYTHALQRSCRCGWSALTRDPARRSALDTAAYEHLAADVPTLFGFLPPAIDLDERQPL